MDIQKIVNSPVSSNCYLISENVHAVVIDPGTVDCAELLENILAQGLIVDYIILTHEHFDHCAGCNILRKQTTAMLVCSRLCNDSIQDSRGNYSAYWAEGLPFVVEAADHVVTDGEEMDWGGHRICFYLAPGHSQGSLTISIDDVALFTGDNYIPNIRTYTNLNGGSKDELRHTLVRLFSFASNNRMMVYPGHLEPLPIFKARFNEAVRGFSSFQMQQDLMNKKRKE